MKQIDRVIVKSGKSWHNRHCVVFIDQNNENIEYTVETTNFILIFLLKLNNKFLNKIALLLAHDYKMTNGWVIEREFKK